MYITLGLVDQKGTIKSKGSNGAREAMSIGQFMLPKRRIPGA